MPRAQRAFPGVRHLALSQVTIAAPALPAALASFALWRLERLELGGVWFLTDPLLRVVTETCPLLQTLVVRQCFLLKQPAVIGPRLRTLVIENCALTTFHDDTTWPNLQELRVASGGFDTLSVRRLVKSQLVGATQLHVLSLTNCFMVEQVLVDPGELPSLRVLNLRSCVGLRRVHVSSTTVQVVDLTLCVALQTVVLDLGVAQCLDLSYLKQLNQLYLRSGSLQTLDLVACAALSRENAIVACPQLRHVSLQGTQLTAQDLNRPDQDTERIPW
ncbi:hypothetical protein P43SY_011532 [Pythium insidiosum]|uniref:Uncharacterized protein n=1 Tax=Pythium insidiosum TaxID=114742 RepID=A0AAD5L703_PYTIN|nr:hypothetical protein P43SY_011532 [Pythium insidiosum]